MSKDNIKWVIRHGLTTPLKTVNLTVANLAAYEEVKQSNNSLTIDNVDVEDIISNTNIVATKDFKTITYEVFIPESLYNNRQLDSDKLFAITNKHPLEVTGYDSEHSQFTNVKFTHNSQSEIIGISKDVYYKLTGDLSCIFTAMSSLFITCYNEIQQDESNSVFEEAIKTIKSLQPDIDKVINKVSTVHDEVKPGVEKIKSGIFSVAKVMKDAFKLTEEEIKTDIDIDKDIITSKDIDLGDLVLNVNTSTNKVTGDKVIKLTVDVSNIKTKCLVDVSGIKDNCKVSIGHFTNK